MRQPNEPYVEASCLHERIRRGVSWVLVKQQCDSLGAVMAAYVGKKRHKVRVPQEGAHGKKAMARADVDCPKEHAFLVPAADGHDDRLTPPSPRRTQRWKEHNIRLIDRQDDCAGLQNHDFTQNSAFFSLPPGRDEARTERASIRSRERVFVVSRCSVTPVSTFLCARNPAEAVRSIPNEDTRMFEACAAALRRDTAWVPRPKLAVCPGHDGLQEVPSDSAQKKQRPTDAQSVFRHVVDERWKKCSVLRRWQDSPVYVCRSIRRELRQGIHRVSGVPSQSNASWAWQLPFSLVCMPVCNRKKCTISIGESLSTRGQCLLPPYSSRRFIAKYKCSTGNAPVRTDTCGTMVTSSHPSAPIFSR